MFQSSFIMKSCLSILLCEFAESGYLPGELIFQPYLWLAIERLCPLTGSDGESILGRSSSSFSYTYQMMPGKWMMILPPSEMETMSPYWQQGRYSVSSHSSIFFQVFTGVKSLLKQNMIRAEFIDLACVVHFCELKT